MNASQRGAGLAWFAGILVLAGSLWGEEPKPDRPAAGTKSEEAEPKLVITPNTVRIQPLDDSEGGHWVVMPGFSELGSPCFSRDGRWIAFDAYREGYNNSPSECWIARQDGSGLKRLAIGATPTWSPDGSQLLFMRDEANDPKHTSGIFLIDRDGTHEQRVCDGRWPAWSPDGKSIVFSLGGQPGGGLRVGATICTARADGTGRQEITAGDCPSWSPDGTKIACCFQKPKAPPMIHVMNLKDRKGTTVGIGWFRANWTLDSKSLVANGVIGPGRAGMVRFPVQESAKPVPLFPEFERPTSPACSFDGKLMVFIAKRKVPAR